MGIFRNFPYTNFHDLNLDWVLDVVRKCEDVIDNWQSTIYDQIDKWLDLHPEAVTTVEDGSITIEKLNDTLKMFLSLGVNVEYLGVDPEAPSYYILDQINDIIAASEYNILVIPPDIDYGYSRRENIELDLSNATNRLIIFDFSRDHSYGTSETEGYNATQMRLWFHTPNEETGQHDGNGFHINADWHPYMKLSANGNSNKRASYFLASDNMVNWQIGQGIYDNDEDFVIARFDDNNVQSSVIAIDKNTGNIGVGSNYRGFPLGIFNKPAIITPGVYLTVENAIGSDRTYIFQKSLDANGETLSFNGTTRKKSILNGNPSETYYLADGTIIRILFNPNSGFTVTNIGATKDLFKLKDSGVFTQGVSGNHFTTANRPTVTEVGAMIYDQSIGKPIWWSGSNWVDATGATV